MEDNNKDLNPFELSKNAYGNILNNIRSYMLLCYVVLLPSFIHQYLDPIEVSTQTTLIKEIFPYLIFTLIILVLLSIFLYRLFMYGRDLLFKLTTKELYHIFSKSFLYTVALAIVLIIALLSVGLLFALVLTVINSSIGGNILGAEAVSTIVWIPMALFLSLIIFRTLPTFTSIAIGVHTVPMKSAYYYTRDNNKNLVFIAIACFLPMTIISALFAYMMSKIGFENNAINLIISYIFLPINVMPYALQISAGVEIFKELVPMEEYTNKQNVDLTV